MLLFYVPGLGPLGPIMVQGRITLRRLVIAPLLVALLVAGSLIAMAGGDEPQVDSGRKPYMVEQEYVGMIGCSVAYWPIIGTDRCSDLDENTQSQFRFPIDAHLTTFVIALTSREDSRGSIADPSVRVAFERPHSLPSISGPLPLIHTVQIDEDSAWVGWDEPSEGRFAVRLDHEAGYPQVAWQEIFDVCLGLFYNGADVPEGYHPCPEA